jgi:Uma2 family endonuclease
MSMFINDPGLEEGILEERKRTGADRWDEVWEGVYVVSPLPNWEHQRIVMLLGTVLEEAIGRTGLGYVFPGLNLSDRDEDWEFDYREPDLVVVLKTGKAIDCDTYLRGPADFLVEVVSPRDRTYEKIPFYDRLGVVELLIVDRDPWKLELYQRVDDRLQKTGESNLENGAVLKSNTVGLSFQLTSGKDRPRIAVAQLQGEKKWLV